MTNLSQHIICIHKYLGRICAKSEFVGLKYHGGPAAECQCKEKGLRILHYVSFCAESKTSDEPNLKCGDCLKTQNVERLLQLQVSFQYVFSYAADVSFVMILQIKDRNAEKEIQSVMKCT